MKVQMDTPCFPAEVFAPLPAHPASLVAKRQPVVDRDPQREHPDEIASLTPLGRVRLKQHQRGGG
jgi:hypothetical protein